MKKRAVIYLIIFATIVNLSALSTFLYFQLQASTSCKRKCTFETFKEKASLSEEQVESFNIYRNHFHTYLDSLGGLLEDERVKLMNQIRNPEPDSLRIKEIVNRVGLLQKQSQYRAIEHFVNIKEVMTAKQERVFFSIMTDKSASCSAFSGSREEVPLRIRK